MTMTQIKRLKDKYLPLFLGFLLFSLFASGQTYNSSVCCTVSNKSYGPAQSVSTDGRSWFYDATNFVMRDYNGTTEVFSYLNLPKYRSGHFPIFVHSGGILQGNGVWLGGITQVYWFKDSTGNANLVRWYTDSTGIAGGPFFAVANNLSEGNPTTIKTNLTLQNVNNTSDATKNAASVSLTNHTINGSLNTLTNIPNSALTNNTIGLTLTATGSDVTIPVTPASLGNSLTINIPTANPSVRGVITGADWTSFHGKIDSTSQSNDSVYDWRNGTAVFRYVQAGAGTGISSLNGLTATSQLFATGTAGSDFNIVSATATHTFNIPLANASNTGKLSNTDWSAFNAKEPAITPSNTVGQYWNGYKQFVTLNTDSIQEGSNHLFFTNTRARAAISLTTAGTSGVSTYNNATGVLNVPNYSGGSGAQTLQQVLAVGNLGTIPILMTLPYPAGTKIAYWFGDSYTFGSDASDTLHAFPAIVSQRLKMLEWTNGVAGSTLEKGSPLNPFGATNMVDRISLIPTYNSTTSGYLFFAFGLNDVGYNGGTYDTTNFRADYITVINAAISKSWPLGKIFIINTFYIANTGYATYAGLSGNAAPTITRQQNYNTAVKNIAVDEGVNSIDIYNYTLNHGDSVNLTSTGIHPNNTGHSIIADGILNGMGDPQELIQDTSELYVGGIIDAFKKLRISSNDSESIILRDSASLTYMSFQRNANNGALYLGNLTPLSTATPAVLNMGGTFAPGGNMPASAKIMVANTAGSVYGFGVSGANGLETFTGTVGKFTIWAPSMVDIEGPELRIASQTGAQPNPDFITMGGSYNTGDASTAKLRILDAGTGSYAVDVNGTEGMVLYGGIGGLNKVTVYGDILGHNTLTVSDSVTLLQTRLGSSSDSILVKHAGVVRAVAQSSIGGGVTTIGTFSPTSIANGGSIAGTTLTLGVGDGTNPGLLSTTTQTIAGNKILTGLLDVGGSSASPGPRLEIEGNNTSSVVTGAGRGFWLGVAQGLTNTATNSGTNAGAASAFFGENTFASTNSGTVYTDAASLWINGAPSAGTNVTLTHPWALYVASGNSDFNGNVSTSGNAVVTSTHFIGNVSSGIAAGTGAGTAPTISISGTDNDGSVTVLSGTTPTGAGATIATITYGFAFPANSFVTLTPANAITAALNGIGMVFTTASNTAWTITAGTTALTGATTYKWFYHVGGN